MGELPPLHTPQGPDVPRALRPRFPRVDSSGTSRVPSSRSASFPFLASSSLHFAHLLSQGSRPPFRVLRFLPLPSLSLRPVLSGSLHVPIQLPPRISPPLFTRVPPPLPSRSSPSLRPVPVGLSTSFSTPPPGSSPPPSARISSGWFLCLGCVFPFFPLPCVQFFPVRLRFPQLPLSFLLLPSPSFPFLSSSSLRFSPLSSASFSRRLPAH